MKTKLTLTLLILNILAFCSLYYLDHTKQAHSTHTQNIRPFAGAPGEIDCIHIEGKILDYPRTLQRTQTSWMLTAPISWPANLFAIQRIITQLEFLEPEISFSVEEIEKSGQTLADYGLDNPNLTITLSSLTHKETISIGKSTEMGNRLYILDSQAKNILVIKESMLEGLNSSLNELANPKVFDLPLYALDSLKIQLLAPHNLTIRLSKNDEKWCIEAPIQAEANNTLVNSVINQLTTLNAQEFISLTNTTTHNPITPNMRLTLQGNNQTQTLLIGEPNNTEKPTHFTAQFENNPTLFTIPAGPILALHDAQEALREKKFLSFDPLNLTNINIALSPSQSLELQKLEDNSWQIVTQQNSSAFQILPADPETIQDLTQALQHLEAIAFISDAPSSSDIELFGLSSPQRTLTLTSNTEPPTTLLLGNLEPETGFLYAKLEDSPFIYKVSPRILSLTPISTLKFKNKTLNKLPQGALIQAIQLKDLTNKKTLIEQKLSTLDQNWEENLKELPPQKHQAIATIINQLRTFKVQEYLQDKFTENVHLDQQTTLPWQYALEIEIYLPGQETNTLHTQEFFFTKRIGGNLQIGGSPEKNTLFTLQQEWIDNLSLLVNINK